MEAKLRQRLIGAVLLIALAVIFIPMLFRGQGDVTQRLQANTADQFSNGFNNQSEDQLQTVEAVIQREENGSFSSSTSSSGSSESLNPSTTDSSVSTQAVASDVSTGASATTTQSSPTNNGTSGTAIARASESSSVSTTTPSTTTAALQTALTQHAAAALSHPVSVTTTARTTTQATSSTTTSATRSSTSSSLVSSTKSTWAVQLASFSEAQRATRLSTYLRSQGYTAYTQTAGTRYGTRTRVFVQPQAAQTDHAAFIHQIRGQLRRFEGRATSHASKSTLPSRAPSSVSATTHSTSTAAGHWSIQLASFSDGSRADRLAQQLHAKGFAAYTQAGPGGLIRVFVGPQSSRQQAQSVASDLQRVSKLHGFIIGYSSQQG